MPSFQETALFRVVPGGCIVQIQYVENDSLGAARRTLANRASTRSEAVDWLMLGVRRW